MERAHAPNANPHSSPEVGTAASPHADSAIVGDITCRIVDDGDVLYPIDAIFAGVDATVVRSELGPRLAPGDQVASSYHCALVRTPTHAVLVDTGLGRIADVDGVPAGRLLTGARRRRRGP